MKNVILTFAVGSWDAAEELLKQAVGLEQVGEHISTEATTKLTRFEVED